MIIDIIVPSKISRSRLPLYKRSRREAQKLREELKWDGKMEIDEKELILETAGKEIEWKIDNDEDYLPATHEIEEYDDITSDDDPDYHSTSSSSSFDEDDFL